jgi:hypothetical protein
MVAPEPEIPVWLERYENLRKELQNDVRCAVEESRKLVDELYQRIDARLTRMESNYVSTADFLARTEAMQRIQDRAQAEHTELWAAIRRTDGVIRWLAAMTVTLTVTVAAQIIVAFFTHQ